MHLQLRNDITKYTLYHNSIQYINRVLQKGRGQLFLHSFFYPEYNTPKKGSVFLSSDELEWTVISLFLYCLYLFILRSVLFGPSLLFLVFFKPFKCKNILELDDYQNLLKHGNKKLEKKLILSKRDYCQTVLK